MGAVGVIAVLGFLVARPLLDLRAVSAGQDRLGDQLGDGDLGPARATAQEVRDDARAAVAHSGGLTYRVLGALPVVGDDAAAVHVLARSTSELTALAPLGVDLVDEVGTRLRTPDGGIDLDLVRDLEPTFRRVAGVTDRATRTASAIDPDRLTWPLAGRARDFQGDLQQLGVAVDGGITATRVLPDLLGADGPRTYLLVVQNNAEIRSTGGLPGSASLLTARDGRIELSTQGSANDIVETGRPIAPFLPGEEKTFSDLLVTDFRDTTFTPDFPRAASLMAAYADQTFPRPVDGVVSVDPVTLAEVLDVLGPVQVGDHRISGDNALSQLLLQPYERYHTNESQDLFFRLAAQAILDKLLQTDGNQAGLVTRLVEAVAQRRLLFWSADETAQQQLQDFPVAGALPRGTGRPEVGFYLDDSTEAKMEYFLRYGTSFEATGCTADGRQRLRATMTLENKFDLDPDTTSPSVVGPYGNVPKGDLAMQLRIFAPEGGDLTGLEVDGEVAEVGRTTVYGRQSNQLRVQLAPGQKTEVVADLVGAPGDDGDPRMQWTPSILWGNPQRIVAPGC